VWSAVRTSSTEAYRDSSIPTYIGWIMLDVSERVVYKARRHGVQLPARSNASASRGIVPISCRCRVAATSPIRHPTAPSRTALPAQHLRPTGFLCGWSVGLEFHAGEPVHGIRSLTGTICDFRSKSPFISETVRNRSMLLMITNRIDRFGSVPMKAGHEGSNVSAADLRNYAHTV